MNSTPSPWILQFCHLVPAGGSVLDLACGGGRHSRLMRDRGHRVTAVDINVGKLEDLASDPQVEVVQADLENDGWPFTDRLFDGIVVTNYLHRPLMPALVSALAPGGVLIYETFAIGNERFGKPSNPDFLLKPNELLHAALPALTVIAYEHGEDTEPKPAMRQRICAVKS